MARFEAFRAALDSCYIIARSSGESGSRDQQGLAHSNQGGIDRHSGVALLLGVDFCILDFGPWNRKQGAENFPSPVADGHSLPPTAHWKSKIPRTYLCTTRRPLMRMVASYCILMHPRPMHGCLVGGTDRSVRCELPTSSFFSIRSSIFQSSHRPAGCWREVQKGKEWQWLCRILLVLSKPTIARRFADLCCE